MIDAVEKWRSKQRPSPTCPKQSAGWSNLAYKAQNHSGRLAKKQRQGLQKWRVKKLTVSASSRPRRKNGRSESGNSSRAQKSFAIFVVARRRKVKSPLDHPFNRRRFVLLGALARRVGGVHFISLPMSQHQWHDPAPQLRILVSPSKFLRRSDPNAPFNSCNL